MTRKQKQRAFIAFTVVVALAVIARQVSRKGLPTVSSTNERSAGGVVAPTLDAGARTKALRAARAMLEGTPPETLADAFIAGQRVLLLTAGRGIQPAAVARGEGRSMTEALIAATADLRSRLDADQLANTRLKLDLMTWRGGEQQFDSDGNADLDPSLEGLWLPGPDLVLLPEELLSRDLVNSKGDLHLNRLRLYLAEGARGPRQLADNPGRAGKPYQRVRFDSFMEGVRSPENGSPSLPIRLYRGNNRTPPRSPAALLTAARAGGDYLLRHQLDDGDFGYNFRTTRNTYDEKYNLLRHAGTCYALAELYEVTGNHAYLEASRRGIEALQRRLRGPKPEHQAAGFEALVSPGEEAKLGGAALTLLALLRQPPNDVAERLPLARRLALFLRFQQEDTGRFHSKYFYGPPDAKEFVSIYYPGEAILALARLYRADPDPRWLETAERGARWLIQVRDADLSTADLPHDHWLLMGLEELYELTQDEAYASHAARIAEAILGAQKRQGVPLDHVGTFYDPPRSTPTATRAEALVAMHRLAASRGDETRPYLEALLAMAAFQQRCQLTGESTLYLPHPARAHGGFRRSLTNWEVRIDYVQHNVSALLGLRGILLEMTG